MMWDSNSGDDEFDLYEGMGVLVKGLKLAAVIAGFATLIVAPLAVIYCRHGADADADGVISRAEYDANVDVILGTGLLSYLKTPMSWWEPIVFIALPVEDAA